MKVKCVKIINPTTGEEFERDSWLTLGQTYLVLEISVEKKRWMSYRLMSNNNSTPAIFDAQQFEVVSNKIPDEWCFDFVSPNYVGITPKAWIHDGFWEDYFNGEPEAEKIFRETRDRLIADDP